MRLKTSLATAIVFGLASTMTATTASAAASKPSIEGAPSATQQVAVESSNTIPGPTVRGDLTAQRWDFDAHTNFKEYSVLSPTDGVYVRFTNKTSHPIMVAANGPNAKWVTLAPGKSAWLGGTNRTDDSLFVWMSKGVSGHDDPHQAQFKFDDPAAFMPSWGLHWRGEGWKEDWANVGERDPIARERAGFRLDGTVKRLNDVQDQPWLAGGVQRDMTYGDTSQSDDFVVFEVEIDSWQRVKG